MFDFRVPINIKGHSIKLTDAEADIFAHLSLGRTAENVAEALGGKSNRTVISHAVNIREKFEVDSIDSVVCYLLHHCADFRADFIERMKNELPPCWLLKNVGLTEVEKIVAIMSFTGGTVEEIALVMSNDSLIVSPTTFRARLSQLHAKLNVHNRIQLLGRLLSYGLLTFPTNDDINSAIERYQELRASAAT